MSSASEQEAAATAAVGSSNDDVNMEAEEQVNLLDLASAAVACTVSASRSIRRIARPGSTAAAAAASSAGSGDDDDETAAEGDRKNTRLKEDGSFVTDADVAAQDIIFRALRSVSKRITIVGEESEEEMERHSRQRDIKRKRKRQLKEERGEVGKEASGADGGDSSADESDEEADDLLYEDILRRTRREMRVRIQQGQDREGDSDAAASSSVNLPLAPVSVVGTAAQDQQEDEGEDVDVSSDPPDVMVDASRVSVFVDPLDGTKSYARGDYDSVSILIALLVDHEPYFGVITKPYGYRDLENTSLTRIRDSRCASVYGGPLLRSVYVAGGDRIVASPIKDESNMPRAVISASRSKGLVHDFCVHLGTMGLIHPEPMLVNGAGEKSLRLILQQKNEALWFYPKAGTCRWDVAAPDAILRSLGGKLTDKYGEDLDYSATSRADAENADGVIACIESELHRNCIDIFRDGNWPAE